MCQNEFVLNPNFSLTEPPINIVSPRVVPSQQNLINPTEKNADNGSVKNSVGCKKGEESPRPLALGECVQCGHSTSLRCANCQKKSGKQLFFCSKNCQKAYWPVHKHFCSLETPETLSNGMFAVFVRLPLAASAFTKRCGKIFRRIAKLNDA